MKPPRTLFSLGRPGTKPASPTLEPAVAAESGTDTVVETVEHAARIAEDAPVQEAPAEEAPVAEVTVVDEPVVGETADAPSDALAAPEVVEAPADAATPATADATEVELDLDAAVPADDTPTALAEPTDVDDVADVGDVVDEPAFDASAEESGYLCGACDTPLPVGATICAACGTPVAGAELFDDPAPAGPADVAAGEVPADAAFDERATLAPGATTTGFDTGAYAAPLTDPPAETAQPAAVLYGEGSGVEPLPPAPEGSWGITQPSFGGVGDDIDGRTDTDTAAAADNGAGAWAGTAVAGGIAAASVAGASSVDAPADATTGYGEPTAVAAAVPATASTFSYSGADASSLPYGTGAVTSSEKTGSKAPIWIAAAVVVVLVGLVGGIMIATGGKDDTGSPAVTPTTAKAAVTSAVPTTAKPTTPTTASATTVPATTATTATTAPTTATTAAPTSTETPTTVATTASSVVATTQAPIVTTVPRQTTIITSPPTAPTTISPGSISPSQPNGAELRIPKGGRASITLTNTGGRPASCAISVGSGNLSLDRNCSPSIAPGASVTINITANPGFEGAGSVSGLLEGVGSYTVPVFVKNG